MALICPARSGNSISSGVGMLQRRKRTREKVTEEGEDLSTRCARRAHFVELADARPAGDCCDYFRGGRVALCEGVRERPDSLAGKHREREAGTTLSPHVVDAQRRLHRKPRSLASAAEATAGRCRSQRADDDDLFATTTSSCCRQRRKRQAYTPLLKDHHSGVPSHSSCSGGVVLICIPAEALLTSLVLVLRWWPPPLLLPDANRRAGQELHKRATRTAHVVVAC